MKRTFFLAAFAAAAFAAGAGCTPSQTPETAESAELEALAPLKKTYPGVVMGFDVKEGTTLIVSLDLNGYIGMDDDAMLAMRHDVVSRWKQLWLANHARAHAELHVRFIDFIGRTVAQQAVRT